MEFFDGLNHALYGVKTTDPLCKGCGLRTPKKDIESITGLCVDCYMAYAADMEMKYGEEPMSERDEYYLAHSL